MGDDPFYRFELKPDHYVCLSTLSKESLDEMGVDGLGDDFGYFVYEVEGRFGALRCVEVLAKCPTFEAANRLLEIYRTRPFSLTA